MLNITIEGIVFTLINLLILTIAMRLVLFKPVQKIIEERQKEVDKELEDAVKVRQEANEMKDKYELSVKDIDNQRRTTLKEAKKTADEEYNKIIERANKEAHEIRKRARATGETQKEQILKDTEKEIAEMALEAASKAVGRQSGESTDTALYDQFLKKAGE